MLEIAEGNRKVKATKENAAGISILEVGEGRSSPRQIRTEHIFMIARENFFNSSHALSSAAQVSHESSRL